MSLDILRVRKSLGRKEWAVPRRFGPDGWLVERFDGTARCIITVGDTPMDEREWAHASISRPDRMPSYEDLAALHKAVWPDGYAYQVFAPPSQHVNIHHYALHLWGMPDGAALLPEFGAMGSI